MSNKLYWQGEHPLGGGKNQLTMGDELPENLMEDPRIDDWLENGTVSKEAVVNFSKQKQNELQAAGEKIIILRDEVESLKDELSAAAKIAKNGKGSAASKTKIADMERKHKKAMADEKVESGDIIAGLQLKIEELEKSPDTSDENKSKASGPKP